MFNYLFPIFCFGVVITGIVVLGIVEAANQVKAEELRIGASKPHDTDLGPESPSGVPHPRFVTRSSKE